MGVGTLLIESTTEEAIEKFCNEADYVYDVCIMPHYGRQHGCVSRYAIAYVDCGVELTCDKCKRGTCPGCTNIQFAVSVRSTAPHMISGVTCTGCMSGNIWTFLDALHEADSEPDKSIPERGVIVYESDYGNRPILDEGEYCLLPWYGGRDDPLLTVCCTTEFNALKCDVCKTETVPKGKIQFLSNRNTGKKICTGCLNESVWSYIASKYHDTIAQIMLSQRILPTYREWYANIIGRPVN